MKTIKEQCRNAYQQLYCFTRKFRLTNQNFTIISNNCCGGIIYHDLGQRFLSPTINLSFSPNDFLLFVENLNEAIQLELNEKKVEENEFPIGTLTLSCKKTIHVNFVHYSSFEQASMKWHERCSRINYDNIFVFMEMGKSTSDDLVKRFLDLPFEHKLAIINKHVDNPYLRYLNIYDGEYFYGKILEHKRGLFAYKRYLDDIDYVKWLNCK